MHSILCLAAFVATVFGSLPPNYPNPYKDWIRSEIYSAPGGKLVLKKDPALLKKYGGTVVHNILAHGIDFTVWQYYGIHAILEVPTMEAGKLYNTAFDFERPLSGRGLNFLEVIGNKEKKLEFMIPDQAVGFRYNTTTPEFTLTLTSPALPNTDSFLCPNPTILYAKNGWSNGAKYDKVYPKNTDGLSYVCNVYCDGVKEGRNFWATGSLADGDQLYLRNLKTLERTDIKPDPSKNFTLNMTPNTDYAVYFIGAKKPNKERKFDFGCQTKE
ncbi:unnamed protein product, partial [Mesorhabditis spiculigera]